MSSGDEGWVRAAARADLKDGEVLGVMVGGLAIALYDVDGQVYATDNICTHAYAHLSDGWLDGDAIECPLHAARFDVKSGAVLSPPANEALKTYPARVAGDAIEVQLG